ncbi:hypothetical protein GCM10023066_12570 [Nocardioides kongjuensis]
MLNRLRPSTAHIRASLTHTAARPVVAPIIAAGQRLVSTTPRVGVLYVLAVGAAVVLSGTVVGSPDAGPQHAAANASSWEASPYRDIANRMADVLRDPKALDPVVSAQIGHIEVSGTGWLRIVALSELQPEAATSVRAALASEGVADDSRVVVTDSDRQLTLAC